MSIESIKRDVAAQFRAAGLVRAAQAVLRAPFDAQGRLVCNARGLGAYPGAAYVGGAGVPQAPRARIPEGPEELIRRALHAAAPVSLRDTPAPLHVPGFPMPGVAEAQPWRHLPPAIVAPWQLAPMMPAPPMTTTARGAWTIPTAAQDPLYQQRAEQVVPRPGLQGFGVAVTPDMLTTKRVTQAWPGLDAMAEDVRAAHGTPASDAFVAAVMTDPEVLRLRSELHEARERRWRLPSSAVPAAHVRRLEQLLHAQMQTAGRTAMAKRAMREVQGKGGYVYQQYANGDIYIVRSPLGPGGAVEKGSPAWRAIVREIGPYTLRTAASLSAWGPPEGRPRPGAARRGPAAPPPRRAPSMNLYWRRVLVRVGLEAAERRHEELLEVLERLADATVQAEIAEARALRLPPAAASAVARRRAAILADLQRPRNPCTVE